MTVISTGTTGTHGVAAVASRVRQLLEAIPASAAPTTVFDAPLLADPNRLRDALAAALPARVVVAGTVDRRLVFAEHNTGDDSWTVADLSGQPHTGRSWPAWARKEIVLADETQWLCRARLSPAAVFRLTRPAVLLAALYHPEHFPLPRFPLAISDLARAARSTLSGQVRLMDMQLGAELADITSTIRDQSPDVVGVSATFGQHDLLESVLDSVAELPVRPLILAGGSLVARNERMLVARYPWLLVARGAGEPTIADAVAHWHGDMAREQIRGIGYAESAFGEGTLSIGRYRHTRTVVNRVQTDIFPELDLLAATFEHGGVAQLEASRGCTNFCSFCPRGHKGSHCGATAKSLGWIVEAMGEIFDAYPRRSRTLYLVDEEFIGAGPDAVSRALEVADVLHSGGFSWETSCRIDQVVDPAEDRSWHVQRADMWRGLRRKGLRRCLFGVESGVTSILERFRKETTGDQNALAIRTLSALGVPTRFTYITFDQLMTAEELAATHAFQARTDLLLRPLPELSVEEIVDGVRDEEFVAKYSTEQPFYQAVTYLLVSMECLIGAAYTQRVQAEGLAGAANPAMGRLEARFADWRIGMCSDSAQRWVDRNFSLDYTFKSLEKLVDGHPRTVVRHARRVIKDAAFAVLTGMVDLLAIYRLDDTRAVDLLATELEQLLNQRWALLRRQMSTAVVDTTAVLVADDAAFLMREYQRWARRRDWTLINAGDTCDT